MNEEVRQKLTQARTALLIDEPFFGSLSMRLKFVENAGIPTLRTNGIELQYNPEFADSLPPAVLKAGIAHEVLHVVNGHCWRRGTRDMQKFNTAADYAINPILQDAGFKLGDDWLIDSQFKGMSAEEIYAQLPDKKQSREDESEEGEGEQGDKSGPGEFTDAPVAEKETLQAQWQVATIQAAKQAQQQGKLPGALKGLIEELTTTRVDWRAALRKFVQTCAKLDYTWTKPNRRYVSHGLYLPSLRSENLPPIVVAIDTSGSVRSVLKSFSSELTAILDEAKPEAIKVIYCDAEVQATEEYEQGDVIKLRSDGGGGTDFRPVFDYVEKEGLEPACLIYLTDLHGHFPQSAPSYPVLWASINKQQASFGETIYIDCNA